MGWRDIKLAVSVTKVSIPIAIIRCRHGPCTETCSVKVLLQCGAYASTQDLNGRSPLHAVIMDAVLARGLRLADQINHFKRAHSKPKMDSRYVNKKSATLCFGGWDTGMASCIYLFGTSHKITLSVSCSHNPGYLNR